ncbi:MAG: DUF3887 domain-containing protein [Sarcina sp.]
MRKLFKGLVLMMPMMFLVACGGAQPLSDKYNEEEVKSLTTEIIIELNEGKFKEVEERLATGGAEKLPESELKKVFEPINTQVGKYKGVSKFVTEEKNGMAFIAAITEFENGKLQFTLSYNEELEITNLFVK